MNQRRFSVVDIGTNSARFLAVELGSGGSWKPLAELRVPCRLGEGLSAGGMLAEIPMTRAIAAVVAFKAAADEASAPIVRAVATHAVRKAGNRDAFLELLRERTGIDLETIAPRTEGRLSYRGIADYVDAGGDAKPARIGVIDTGGGSVQLTVGIADVPVASVSMPLGAVALTEQFGGPEQSASAQFEALHEHIAAAVEEGLARLPFLPARIYGVGGGCTSAGVLCRLKGAGKLIAGTEAGAKDLSAQIQASGAEIRELMRFIRPMTVAERSALPGLSVERAQILVPGLAVIDALLQRLRPHMMTTAHVGLRDGLVVETVEAVRVRSAARRQDRRTILQVAARTLADRCRAEQPHSGHVAMLAIGLHRDLVKLAEQGRIKKGRWCRRRSAAILHAAGLLHDSGVAVSYKGHHKHSEAIVLFNGLAGVRLEDSDLVAGIARYHRKGRPSRRHELYGGMDKKDRRLVRMLAGILRIADGFDRSHRQLASRLHVRMDDDQLVILGEPAERSEAVEQAMRDGKQELSAAAEKSDLLSRVLGRKISVAWMSSSPTSESR